MQWWPFWTSPLWLSISLKPRYNVFSISIKCNITWPNQYVPLKGPRQWCFLNIPTLIVLHETQRQLFSIRRKAKQSWLNHCPWRPKWVCFMGWVHWFRWGCLMKITFLGVLVIWQSEWRDVHKGTLHLGLLRGHTHWSVFVIFSLMEIHCHSGSHDKTIKSVGCSERKGTTDLGGPFWGTYWLGQVCCIFSWWKILVAGLMTGPIRAWDIQKGNQLLLLGPFAGHTDLIVVKSVCHFLLMENTCSLGLLIWPS